MPTCPRTCSRTPSTAPHRPSRSTTLKRTLPPTSRRSLTRNTTRRGIASSEGTLARTSRTKRATLFTSTSGRWQYCYSRADKGRVRSPPIFNRPPLSRTPDSPPQRTTPSPPNQPTRPPIRNPTHTHYPPHTPRDVVSARFRTEERRLARPTSGTNFPRLDSVGGGRRGEAGRAPGGPRPPSKFGCPPLSYPLLV